MMRTERLWANGAIFMRASALWARLRRPLLMAGMLFLMMHASLIPGHAPLAAALFAAALAANENLGALAAGCILGALRIPVRGSALLPAIACACILAGELLFSTLRALKKTQVQLRISILAGFGVLLPALVFAGGELLASMQALACAALAAASAPFFLSALNLHKERRWYLAEERAGTILMAGGALCGLYALLPPAAEIAAGLIVMLLPSAATGVFCGIFLLLGGAPPLKLASLAVCALAAGQTLLPDRKFRALAACACGVLARFLFGPDVLSWYALPAACAAWLLLPDSYIEGIRRFLLPEAAAADPDRIAQALSAETQRRLRALGDAFGDMAEVCTEPSEVMGEQELICAMRERLCSGCAEYASCWAGSENRAARFLCGLIGDAIDLADAPPGHRVLFSDGEIPPDVLRMCRRGRMIPDRLGFLLRDFVEKRRAEIKRSANDRILSVHFLQAREILYSLAQRQAMPMHFHGAKIDRVRAALDSAGLGDLTISVRGAQEIALARRGNVWSRAEILRAGSELSRAFGGRYIPERMGPAVRFTRHPRLGMQAGVTCQSGMPGAACGDSHILRMLGGERMMALICDGMGMGEAAARESCEAAQLLWRFLNAEISRPLAIETVNRQLLMRSGEEMFATVDLCLIDLNSGVAEFTKLGASRTIILRGGETLSVDGGYLPLGILEDVQPSVTRLRLRPGDLIIMGSDGVMEAGDGRMIERLARAGSGQDPQQLSEQLVREAALRRAHGRADDMSCICLRIERAGEEKRAANA